MTAARRLASVPEKDPAARPPDLRDAVRDALAVMNWLTAADKALAAIALRQAEEIERTVERAELFFEVLRESGGDPSVYKRLQRLEALCDVAKVVGTIAPQLQATMRDLGGAPAARKAFAPDKPVGGRLAEIRAAARQHNP